MQISDLQPDDEGAGQENRTSTLALASASVVAAGIQFGWALQLSLLTPYVQVCVAVSLLDLVVWNSC